MYRSLLNDFAFKYVFGADTKESNEALKGILEIYLNMKGLTDTLVTLL